MSIVEEIRELKLVLNELLDIQEPALAQFEVFDNLILDGMDTFVIKKEHLSRWLELKKEKYLVFIEMTSHHEDFYKYVEQISEITKEAIQYHERD